MNATAFDKRINPLYWLIALTTILLVVGSVVAGVTLYHLYGEVKTHKEEKEIALRERSALQKEVDQLKEEKAHLDKQVMELTGLQGKVEKLEQEKTDLNDQITKLNEKLAENELGMNGLNEEKQKLDGALIEVQEQLDTVKKERDQLQQKFDKRNEFPPTGTEIQDKIADNLNGPKMIAIKGDCYDMKRVKRVCVKDFYIGKYEVTFAEYDQFAKAMGRAKPYDWGWGRDKRPVIDVNWNDAVAYTEWLSEQTGRVYRLPTEAEWEYAARAGTETAYWWGDQIGSNNANCSDCGSQWDGKETAPVGKFKANPWGLHNTAGNVREWTSSKYNNENSDRLILGGSWRTGQAQLRFGYRVNGTPTYGNRSRGFRLARSP